MDTHTHPAHDLLTSGGQFFEIDEHEAAGERSAHLPPRPEEDGAHDPAHGDGHAEKDGKTTGSSSGEHELQTPQPLIIPGEHEPETGNPSSPAAPVLAAKPSTRQLLLGTALALTLMIGGGGLYIMSHHGHTVRMASMPPPAWHPEQVAHDPADPISTLPASMVQPPLQHGAPAHENADDILAMRHASVTQAAAAPLAPKPAAVAVTRAPPVMTVAPPVVAAAAPARPDPVTTALALRPAPMTPTQQVDVLSLVTQLAAIVRDMRHENAQLRDKVMSLDETVKSETSDVSQRLNLMEARKAIASAQDAGKPPEPVVSGSQDVVPVRVVRSVAVVPVAVRSVRDYRVQAASPGLAILADANAAPGQSAGLQVSVGDQVPGVGRITSIAQRGTAWVVQTSHGAIQ